MFSIFSIVRRVGMCVVMGSVVLGSSVWAADASMGSMQGMQMSETAVVKTFPLHGVIKAIDATALQLTLQHNAVQALNWPAMTMPFQVKDAALLKGLKTGQTIDAQFTTEDGQAPTIVSLKTSK
jgi:Cu(I)/Ag(I) efflux system protein CusF